VAADLVEERSFGHRGPHAVDELALARRQLLPADRDPRVGSEQSVTHHHGDRQQLVGCCGAVEEGRSPPAEGRPPRDGAVHPDAAALLKDALLDV